MLNVYLTQYVLFARYGSVSTVRKCINGCKVTVEKLRFPEIRKNHTPERCPHRRDARCAVASNAKAYTDVNSKLNS